MLYMRLLSLLSLLFNNCLNFPDVPKTPMRWVPGQRTHHVKDKKGGGCSLRSQNKLDYPGFHYGFDNTEAAPRCSVELRA